MGERVGGIGGRADGFFLYHWVEKGRAHFGGTSLGEDALGNLTVGVH